VAPAQYEVIVSYVEVVLPPRWPTHESLNKGFVALHTPVVLTLTGHTDAARYTNMMHWKRVFGITGIRDVISACFVYVGVVDVCVGVGATVATVIVCGAEIVVGREVV